MKVGDLVRYNYIKTQTIKSCRVGIVIKNKLLIYPKKRNVMVMWPDKIERELCSGLKVINESR